MQGAVKRFFRWALEAIGSEGISRIIVAVVASGSAGLAVLKQSTLATWSIAGAFASVLAVGLVKRTWEYRHENYRVIERRNLFHLEDSGRKVTYSMEMKVRSSQKNLRACYLRCAWSGESHPGDQDNWERIGNNFEVIPKLIGSLTEFKFVFTDPIRRFRSRRVGVKCTLAEPGLVYSQHLGLETSAWAWSPFAKLVTELSWSNGAVNPDSIIATANRSSWDRHRKSTSSMNRWMSDTLKKPATGNGRTWTVTPVRPDRYYYLSYSLVAKPTAPNPPPVAPPVPSVV
jgi:hypothetical protein